MVEHMDTAKVRKCPLVRRESVGNRVKCIIPKCVSVLGFKCLGFRVSGLAAAGLAVGSIAPQGVKVLSL
jgi:hypothetical protein